MFKAIVVVCNLLAPNQCLALEDVKGPYATKADCEIGMDAMKGLMLKQHPWLLDEKYFSKNETCAAVNEGGTSGA